MVPWFKGDTGRARAAVVAYFVLAGLAFSAWAVRIPDVKAALRLDDATLGLALLGAATGSVVAMTASDELNALAARQAGMTLGRRQIYQLPPDRPEHRSWWKSPIGTFGRPLFGPEATFTTLERLMEELKRRIESDQADARLGAAVLSLARRFTAAVAERPAAAAASGTEVYTVKPNDSLWKIAAKRYGDRNADRMIKEIRRLNPDLRGDLVRVDQKLVVPTAN